MQSSNGKSNMDQKHQEIHQQHMPHISQIISSISTRLLQLHPCKPAKKSINAMQCIQNIRTKIIVIKRSRDSTIECLGELNGCQYNKEQTLKYSYSYSNMCVSPDTFKNHEKHTYLMKACEFLILFQLYSCN